MPKKLMFVCLSVVALGCGSTGRGGGGGGSSFCAPGATNACFCASGEEGQQFCNEEGTEFSACLCGGVDPATDASVDAAMDAANDAPSSDTMSGSDTSVDSALDTGTDTTTPPPPVTEQHFVIRILDVPGADEFPMPGFDLDGTSAAVCGIPDFDSGVDNQLANLRMTIDSLGTGGGINEATATSIANGEILLLVDIANGGAPGSVDITFRRGLVPPGARLTLEGGLLAPGQTIDIDTRMTAVTAPGTFDGEAVRTTEDTELVLFVGGLGEFLVQRARFAGTVADDGNVEGALGGAMTIDDLVTAALPSLPPGFDEATARTVLGGQADLDDTDDGCQSMSLGWRIAAVPYVPGVVR